MKEVIKNIFEKIEFSIIVFTIYLATIFFTIMPVSIVEKLSLLEFKNKYQFVFSICFIIFSCYYLASIVNWAKKKINVIRFKKHRSELIKKLSPEEKQYVMAFYNKDTKQFDTSSIFDITNAVVNLLEHKQIIGRGSSLSVGYTEFSYFLQPWAQEYLNKQLKEGHIVVEKDKFSWN